MTEIDEALLHYGIRPRSVVLISPLRERKGRRLAYRLDDEMGRTFKVRQFESPDAARSVFELQCGLEEAFASALARHGSVLLEEWIDGTPLSPRDAHDRAVEAGALLGRLHTRASAPGAPSPISTRSWLEAAESDLDVLGAARQLTADEVARLRRELRARNPREAPATIIHLDFCAENMLVDPRGALRIIDNEQLEVGPAGLDLARTFERWPMSENAWTRFRRGYRSSAPRDPGFEGFWRIVAALVGARVLLQRAPPRLDASVALLRRFAEGRSLSESSVQ